MFKDIAIFIEYDIAILIILIYEILSIALVH